MFDSLEVSGKLETVISQFDAVFNVSTLSSGVKLLLIKVSLVLQGISNLAKYDVPLVSHMVHGHLICQHPVRELLHCSLFLERVILLE